jgi:hypothetical protein
VSLVRFQFWPPVSRTRNAVVLPEYGISLNHPRQEFHLFFEIRLGVSIPLNLLEPEKCEKLEFFPISKLPSNTVDYVVIALDHIMKGEFYSEIGWDQ